MLIKESKLVQYGKAKVAATITSSRDAYSFMKPMFKETMTVKESFWIICLNNSNKVITWSKISEGGIAGTLVDKRIVARTFLESGAVAGILCHNHPSGTLKPSQADINITEKIRDAMNLFDFQILDHIILTEYDYYSFADDNLVIF